MSPTIQGLITVDATVTPRKKRIAMSIPMLLLLAAATVNTMNRILAAWYVGNRPYSARGAINNGPTTSPSSLYGNQKGGL